MATEPLPTAGFVDPVAALHRNGTLRMVYWIVILFLAGVLTFLWFKKSGHPVYALLVTGWTFILTPGMAVVVIWLVPSRSCRVPTGEHVLHRILGVRTFGWLLERSGWNRRNIYPAWGFSITRTHLAFRALAARIGGSAHAACFAIHILVATATLLAGHPWGALWILLPGVVVHLYPVLLQRSIMLRLQPLLDKYSTSR